MSAREMWTMFSPRGTQPGRPGGGRPLLTAADAARALQGLERGCFLMGMAKETGDCAVLSELEQLLAISIEEMAYAFSWPVDARRYYRRFAGIVVLEVLVPRPVPCPRCGGVGYVVIDHQGVACEECSQTGGFKLSARARADFIGIAWSSWRDKWDARYEFVHSVACTWHEEAIDRLAQRIPALLARASPC